MKSWISFIVFICGAIAYAKGVDDGNIMVATGGKLFIAFAFLVVLWEIEEVVKANGCSKEKVGKHG